MNQLEYTTFLRQQVPGTMIRILCSIGGLLSLLPLTAMAQAVPASSVTASAASATTDAPSTVLYVSSAEMAGRIPKLQAAAEADKPLPEDARATPSWGPYQGHMGYRTTPQPLLYTNDDFAEYYSILDGEGAMTLGGTLTNPKRTGPHAESATAQGAKVYRLAKGDLLMVPPGVPHGISQVRGKLVYISMHLALQPKMPASAP
jgi:mannose-6-phosphate isomerase-like protein (cupin superfamily)